MPTLELVHSDARGEMYSISLPGDRELMLLFSRKGTRRGGHSHSVPETIMLLDGKMRYHKLNADCPRPPEELGPGDCSRNEAGEVHMGEFTEPTWLIEFKLAKKGEWTQENYIPWRRLVEESLK